MEEFAGVLGHQANQGSHGRQQLPSPLLSRQVSRKGLLHWPGSAHSQEVCAKPQAVSKLSFASALFILTSYFSLLKSHLMF